MAVNVDNVVITTKGLRDRNTHILDGTTVENKGKLILTKVCFSVRWLELLDLWLSDRFPSRYQSFLSSKSRFFKRIFWDLFGNKIPVDILPS